MSFLKKLIAGRQRSADIKIAQQLRNSEYPNETVEFVLARIRANDY